LPVLYHDRDRQPVAFEAHGDGLSDKGVRALGERFCFTGASVLRDTLRHWCKRIGASWSARAVRTTPVARYGVTE